MTETEAPVTGTGSTATADDGIFLGCVVCRRPVGPDGACGCSGLAPTALTPVVHRHAAEAVLASLVGAAEASAIVAGDPAVPN